MSVFITPRSVSPLEDKPLEGRPGFPQRSPWLGGAQAISSDWLAGSGLLCPQPTCISCMAPPRPVTGQTPLPSTLGSRGSPLLSSKVTPTSAGLICPCLVPIRILLVSGGVFPAFSWSAVSFLGVSPLAGMRGDHHPPACVSLSSSEPRPADPPAHLPSGAALLDLNPGISDARENKGLLSQALPRPCPSHIKKPSCLSVFVSSLINKASVTAGRESRGQEHSITSPHTDAFSRPTNSISLSVTAVPALGLAPQFLGF